MRVAVVGLGYWGPNLVRNLLGIRQCSGVIACDKDSDKVAAIVRQFPSVTPAGDFAKLLKDPTVDAVILATPVASHASLARRVINAGKGVLIEKPLATSTRDAEGLIERAGRAGLVLMAGHTFLYSPPVKVISELAKSGELGALMYLQSSRVNLGIHQSDTSVIWDLGPHDVSIAQEWLGEPPIIVTAVSRASMVRHPADVAFLTMTYPSGFLASIHLSWLAPTKVRRTTLVGTKKMVLYEDTNSEEPVRVYDKGVIHPNPADFGEYRLSYRTGSVVAPAVPPSEPLRLELQEFIGRVVRGDSVGPAEEAALGVVRTLEAAERSIKGFGRPVKLR